MKSFYQIYFVLTYRDTFRSEVSETFASWPPAILKGKLFLMGQSVFLSLFFSLHKVLEIIFTD